MTTEAMLEVPERMRRLPVDKHGRPVPWFVAWFDDAPDHRVVRQDGIPDAVSFDWCWTCGQTLGRHRAYVVGPMCVVNRISAEPPSHRDCAEYSARACPFLSNPTMRRRENGLPDDKQDPGGVMLLRNPGVAVVWPTAGRTRLRRVPGGVVFPLGALDGPAPAWWHRGRPATREEATEALDTGLPSLLEAREQDLREAGSTAQRDQIVAAFDQQVDAARLLLPA